MDPDICISCPKKKMSLLAVGFTVPNVHIGNYYFFHSSEDKVIDHYKKLKGLTRGQAIVK